jgi:hypothetical protein
MKFLIFLLFLWVIFALLDPDPGTPMNPDLIWIRIHNTEKRDMKKEPVVWKTGFLWKVNGSSGLTIMFGLLSSVLQQCPS